MELEPTLETQAPTMIEAASADVATDQHEEALVEEELLVEEISIDGMCGVY